MSAFHAVVESLPHLTEDELRKVAARVGFLLTCKNESSSSDDSLILDCIASALQSRGIEFSSIAMLRKSSVYNSFRSEKVPAILAYFDNQNAKFTRNELRMIISMGVDLLIDALGAQGLGISGRTLLSHSHRIPSVINAAFPGYAQSGILSMIVRRKVPA